MRQEETPGEMIERLERETGQRIDAPGSMALAGLVGAVARAMGKNPHGPRDDVAAGLMIQHQMAHGEQERQEREMMAGLLLGGLGPDEIAALFGRGKP